MNARTGRPLRPPEAFGLLQTELGRLLALFDLSGVAGGVWQVGRGEPAATIQTDVLDFNVFASGRSTPEEALARATVSGDTSLAKQVLGSTLILF